MADYAALRGSLTHLKGEIQQRLPALLLGRPQNESEADRRSDELVKFAERLELLSQHLKNHESLLALQARQARGAAGWAAKDRLHDAQRVKKEAEDLARLIKDLMDRNGINLMQAGQQVHELIDNLDKSNLSHSNLASLQHAFQQLTGTIGPPPGPVAEKVEPLAMMDSAVPFVTIAAIMFRKAARYFKGRR
jgi:hypothetical protein